MGHRPKTQNRLSHVVFVVDESGSMQGLTAKVKQEILAQIDTMVAENTEADHEIRASLYTFQGDQWGARTRDDHVHCVLYDMDVLRMKQVLTLPAMKDWYQPDGLTALIDATCKAIEELEETAQRYGEHNFLVYVVTDGGENASVTPAHVLQKKLASLPSSWTVGALVPNRRGESQARELGFAPDNILIWDATSAAGLASASKSMQTATSTILRSHRTGQKPTGGLFSTGAETVNSQTVQDAGLKPVPTEDYERLYAHQKERIDALVNEKSVNLPYKRGNGFYQLTKRETIQGHKKLLVWDRQKKVLLQGGVRSLLNLPEGVDVTIPKPQENDRYEVYVQSGADNRVIPEKAHAVIVRDKTKLA